MMLETSVNLMTLSAKPQDCPVIGAFLCAVSTIFNRLAIKRSV